LVRSYEWQLPRGGGLTLCGRRRKRIRSAGNKCRRRRRLDSASGAYFRPLTRVHSSAARLFLCAYDSVRGTRLPTYCSNVPLAVRGHDVRPCHPDFQLAPARVLHRASPDRMVKVHTPRRENAHDRHRWMLAATIRAGRCRSVPRLRSQRGRLDRRFNVLVSDLTELLAARGGNSLIRDSRTARTPPPSLFAWYSGGMGCPLLKRLRASSGCRAARRSRRQSYGVRSG
jgi:hypothetical protein